MMANIVLTRSAFVILLMIQLSAFVSASEDDDEVDMFFTTRRLYADLLRELDGAHLRISASHSPDSMIIESNSDGTDRYRGYAVYACDYMAMAFGFNYSFVKTQSDEVQKFGTKEAAVQMLLRNEVDMVSTEMIFSLDTFSRMSVSIPLYRTGTALIVPWPDLESRLLAPIRVFDSMVWLAVLGMILTMTLSLALIPRIYNKLVNKSIQIGEGSLLDDVGDAALNISANLTSHQGFWKSSTRKQLSYRIIVGSWLLVAFVLVTAFSSLLISFLALPKLMPATKSYDDIAYGRPQKLKFLTEKNGNTALLALTATSGRNKLLGDSLRAHPESLFSTPKDRFDLLYTGHYTYPAGQHTFYTLLDALNKKAGYCRFTASTKRMPDVREVSIVFGFQKNWRYSDAIRNKMQRWTDSGLAMHWIKSYQPRGKGCLLDDYKKNAPKQRVLSLIDLSSAFAVLALGYGLSLLVFLLEITYRKISRLSRRTLSG